MIELHACASQLVQVRGAVRLAAITFKHLLTNVVGEDEENIRLATLSLSWVA
jgi:hypothetical protein